MDGLQYIVNDGLSDVVACGDLSVPVPDYLVVVDMADLEGLGLPWPPGCAGCQVLSVRPGSLIELHIPHSVLFAVSFLPLLLRLCISFSGVFVVLSL